VAKRRIWISSSAAIFAAVLVTACSSSGSSSTTSGSAAGASTSSGKPITIGFIGSLQSATYSFPETAAAAQAEVDAVNAAGGIHGAKVTLSVCNDQASTSQAVVCVRQMTSAGAVGVIGGISTVGETITGDLQAANLVYTGERPLSPGELNSPISFPMVGGGESSASGLAVYAAQTAGCKRPYMIVSDSSPSELTGAAFAAGFKYASHGTSVGKTVTPSPNTSYAAAAADAVSYHADCVFFSLDVPEGPKAIPTLRAALPDAKFFNTAGAMPAPIIQALGKAADGIYLSDSVLPVNDTMNATLNQFKAEMAKYEPKQVVDGFAVTSWLGTRLLLDTITDMTAPVTAQNVLNAFNQLGAYNGQGVIGSFNFQTKSPIATAKREVNLDYLVFQVENGTYQVTDPTFQSAAAAMGA
jgi:ABC-type branched-subunit amino acid transport system substrate-binding protein